MLTNLTTAITIFQPISYEKGAWHDPSILTEVSLKLCDFFKKIIFRINTEAANF